MEVYGQLSSIFNVILAIFGKWGNLMNLVSKSNIVYLYYLI